MIDMHLHDPQPLATHIYQYKYIHTQYTRYIYDIYTMYAIRAGKAIRVCLICLVCLVQHRDNR